jgi:uncharacterized protein involved in exopolysaccharide biosynthesis
MSGVQSTASDIDVDLRLLFASLLRRWKRIVVVAVLAALAALALATLATPQYKGETRLLIETRESVFTRPDTAGDPDRAVLDEEGVISQVEVVQSSDILKQVAQQLGLAKLPEFDEAAGMSQMSRALVSVGL